MPSSTISPEIIGYLHGLAEPARGVLAALVAVQIAQGVIGSDAAMAATQKVLVYGIIAWFVASSIHIRQSLRRGVEGRSGLSDGRRPRS